MRRERERAGGRGRDERNGERECARERVMERDIAPPVAFPASSQWRACFKPGGIACSLIRNHDHFTSAREMRRDVRAATAHNHPENTLRVNEGGRDGGRERGREREKYRDAETECARERERARKTSQHPAASQERTYFEPSFASWREEGREGHRGRERERQRGRGRAIEIERQSARARER